MPTSAWASTTAPTHSSATMTATCTARTSSTTGATRRWGAPGATSTSPRSGVRRSGRTHPRDGRRPRRTSGGGTTTRLTRRPVATYVLIHGAGDSAANWELVAAELREGMHDVVAVDLPCDDESAGLTEYTDTVVEAVGDRRGLVVVAH